MPKHPGRGGGDGGRDRHDPEERGRERGRGQAQRPARERHPRPGPVRPDPGRGGERPGQGRAAAESSIEVGATANKPELVQTIPIAARRGAGAVVLSLGPHTDSDQPLPEIAAGDRLLAFAELELTTDADDPNHPGLIGNAYSYSPKVEATLLLAGSPGAAAPGAGGAIELVRKPWQRAVSHQQHHAVVTFGDGELAVAGGGLPWKGPAYVNLVVGASNPDAQPGDVLLVGQNEKTPTVVQDMAGIRVVRLRPGDRSMPAAERESACRCAGVPVAKQGVVVLSHELAGLGEGEQILAKARLVTDAAGLPAAARISTRLFLADAPDQTEPGGRANSTITWKGQLSKFTGFNCLPGDGPQTSNKYGVATVRQAPGRSLYVNLVAVSAAPFGGGGPADQLRIDTAASWLEVTRFAAPG